MAERRLIDANEMLANESEAYMYAQSRVKDEGTRLVNMAVHTKIQMLIADTPTVDALEVVHGRWVRLDAHRGIEQFKCSVCRSECYVPTCMYEPMYAYCPNCGAKMDGERKDDGTDRCT